VPFAQGNHVSFFFQCWIFDFYIYHTAELLSERGTDEEKERARESKGCEEQKEHEERTRCFFR
jgi:hypothetical protein